MLFNTIIAPKHDLTSLVSLPFSNWVFFLLNRKIHYRNVLKIGGFSVAVSLQASYRVVTQQILSK
jgi:hypothetical protein